MSISAMFNGSFEFVKRLCCKLGEGTMCDQGGFPFTSCFCAGQTVL